MIGQTISHYKILEKLGEGGMGVVYRAEDTKLKRNVALKFLPSSSASSADELARFQLEAEAISALNHPGIATIYDVDEIDGRKFLALEYIPGGTLKSKIAKLLSAGKTLPVEEATGYAIEMAEGLGHAHRNGIVHRDIKSDNVLLSDDGRVKITDFGLAKLRGTSQLTQAGSTIGTLAYMAPEQMRGEDVDARADIFSLGVVFFELLTGRMPFQGEHDTAIMYSVLNEEPLPVSKFRPDAPAHLQSIIDKMLKKDPANRYQDMANLLADLKAPPKISSPVAPKTADTRKSIVVLPFENNSPDKENEYFSDGLTEEIISDLSKIRSLRVISRTSAMLLKGTTKDVRTIAGDLNVRYVLEGSVRKAGQNLRITAQLIDGTTDANLWGEKYSGTLDDVFEMQEKVSRAIVGALKVTLSDDEERRMEERPIRDAKAHDLYMRARAEYQRGDAAALKRSIELLNEGLSIVGDNELLFAALGYSSLVYFRWIDKTDESHLARANEYVRKTFEMNPRSTHGLTLQGLIHYSEGDIGSAIRSLRSAIEIEPTNTEALLWLSIYSTQVGNFSEGIQASDTLISLDPLTAVNIWLRGFNYIYNGEFAEGLQWLRRGYAMDIKAPLTIWSLAIGLAWCGEIDEAVTVCQTLGEEVPGWVYTQHALFLMHALKGEREEALRYATDDLVLEAKHDGHFALHVSHCYALIGEKTKALDFLEQAVRTGMVNHPFLSKNDPLLENVRKEKRFTEIMETARQELNRLPI